MTTPCRRQGEKRLSVPGLRCSTAGATSPPMPQPVKNAKAKPKFRVPATRRAPRVGLVSLGCPKALVDSERIITQLRSEGYQLSPDYAGADVVLVNTCGFLDSAK